MSALLSPSIQPVITFENSQGVEARGTLTRVARTGVIFEVYNPYSIVQLSEVLSALVIRRGNRPIYNGRATVENLMNTGQMLIVSVRLQDSWQDLSGILDNREAVFREVDRFVDDWRMSNALNPEYQLVSARLRVFLGETSRWLEQVDLPSTEPGTIGTSSLDDARFHDMLDAIRPHAQPLLAGLEEAAHGLRDEEVPFHKAALQRDIHPFVLSAPFVHRAYTKPLGYAGDYEMVNMMLYNRREGPTTFAQLVNALYLESGPAAAHRNRIDVLIEFLLERIRLATAAERTLRVLDVGCGPAQELQKLILDDALVERCHIDLMDFNQETLDYTRGRIDAVSAESGHRPQVDYVHRSVHQLLKQSVRRRSDTEQPEYDVVYCAGLFDYLSDKVCSRLLALFYRWTVPGGAVLATNVHPSNPIRAFMEHAAEWYLIYRDEQDMAKLAPGLGRQQVFSESTGINIFLRIDKPSDEADG